jgi:hypothetical protein
VVCPAGVRDIDLLSVRVEALDEGSPDPQSTGSRDCLCDGDAVFLDGGGPGAKSQLGGSLGESGNSGDASVFFVQARADDLVFSSPDGGQDVGFAFVVA